MSNPSQHPSWTKCENSCPSSSDYKSLTTILVRNNQGGLDTQTIKMPTTPRYETFSINIRNASHFSIKGQYTLANKTLNQYNSWSGAPGGYGAPPKNTF